MAAAVTSLRRRDVRWQDMLGRNIKPRNRQLPKLKPVVLMPHKAMRLQFNAFNRFIQPHLTAQIRPQLFVTQTAHRRQIIAVAYAV